MLLLFIFTIDVPPVSAATEPLRWEKVSIPSQNEAGRWVLAEGSDINTVAIAADGSIYAGVSGSTNILLKSTDGGSSWTAIGSTHDTIIDIAISSADTARIYYTTSDKVYRSENGGKTFESLAASPGGAGTGNKQISAFDLASSDGHIVAVSVRDTDDSEFGGVYILDETDIVPSWQDTDIGNYDVCALSFSPSYHNDYQIVAVTTDETDTFVMSKIGDSGWNTVTGVARLNRDNTIPPTSCAAISAAIAFPESYTADPSLSGGNFYVSIATGNDGGDVYQIELKDAASTSTAVDLNAGQKYGYDNIDINAIAVIGSFPDTVLIAGDTNSSLTYTSPDGGINWKRSRKEASGTTISCLITDLNFNDTGRILAATSGSNSGISVSTDLGVTWNQISLIDTTIDIIFDLEPSPQYAQDKTIFMLTFGNGPSLWRTSNDGQKWERILTGNTGTGDTFKFIGLPPVYGNDNQTVYLAGESNGAPAIWHSTDNGQSYRCRPTCEPGTGESFPIDTWAIFDESSLFIGSYDGSHGIVYQTNNSGFTYSTGTIAGTYSLNSLEISPFFRDDGVLLAGNINGGVYISTDNNSSFHTLPADATTVPLSGAVTVAFNPEFDENHVVYAASKSANGGIYRINIASGYEWKNIDSTLPTGAMITSLATGDEGTLYAANTKADGGMERCLNPTASNTAFEQVTTHLPDGAILCGLWQRDHRLWSVDTTGPYLLVFNDTLTIPVTQISPTDNTKGIGTLNDHTVRNIVLDWTTANGATSYEWQCDYLSDFSPDSVTLGDNTSASTVRLPELEPAATYHWRIRVNAPFLSPWSKIFSFTTGLDNETVTLKTEIPAPGATAVAVKPSFQWTAISGASAYELMVADNFEFEHPVINCTEQHAIPANAWKCHINLDYDTTYYWKVRPVSESTRGTWSSTGLFTTVAETGNTADPTALLPTSLLSDNAVAASSNPIISSAPMPMLPTQTQIMPLRTTSPQQGTGLIPDFNQSVDLPAWAIYLIFGLLGTVILAMLVILVIVVKIRR